MWAGLTRIRENTERDWRMDCPGSWELGGHAVVQVNRLHFECL